MKNVERLSITVTYEVGLHDIGVPDEVYEQLLAAAEQGKSIYGDGDKYQEATEWLNNNINEHDAFECYYEINDIE
jgi:hypothetical protein